MPLVSRNFDQLIDFTRTSAATFVGSNGLIQTTPQSRNLLTFTQEFDNAAWNKSGATVTANITAAPDGTATADALVEDASTGLHLTQQFFTFLNATAYTFSIYVRPSTRTWVSLTLPSAAFGAAQGGFFDLTGAGALGNTTGTPTSRSITAVGGGWYRITVTATSTAAAGGNVAVVAASANGTTSYAGNSSTAFFLWGAQLEVGSTATDYTRNFGGVFPPRFDYDPVTLAPRGLLIEEQRTNLLVRSEEFDTAAWSKTNATVTANSTAAPDGTNTADTLVEDTTNAGHTVSSGNVTVALGAVTWSVYAKAGTRSWMWLNAFAGSNNRTWFNLANGTVGTTGAGATASITSVGNGWYRCAVTLTSGTTTVSMGINAASGDNITGYAGTASAAALFLWGAQLETGSFATSYIPTGASQVTRTADIATINAPNFAPWYRADEGTFVVEANVTAISSKNLINLRQGTGNANELSMYVATNSPVANSNVGGVSQFVLVPSGTVQSGLPFKLSLGYAVNNFAASANGGALATDVSGSVASTLDRMWIGSAAGTVDFTSGHIRSIRYYPVRLSNAQLQALTA